MKHLVSVRNPVVRALIDRPKRNAGRHLSAQAQESIKQLRQIRDEIVSAMRERNQ